MSELKEVVLKIHTELMKERGIDKVSSEDLEIRPRNGITSESIVSFILDIEDALNIELDEYLPRIRTCKTIGLFIDIVAEAYQKQHTSN